MLTDAEARKALPGERDYKLADAGGLHLFVSTKGHKSWRLKYRFGGKERRLVFGTYPDLSLKRARELRDDAKLALREGNDPGLASKRARHVRRKAIPTRSSSSPAIGTRDRRTVGSQSMPPT